MTTAPTMIAAAALVGTAAVSCARPPAADDGALVVVTTVSPITNLVENVGGPHVRVAGLIPEGRNSHAFEPAPGDARLVAEADLFVANGLNLELPSLRLARANLADGAEILELGPRTVRPAEYIFDFSFPRDKGDPNPHLWTNPPYVKRFAEIIKDAIAARDPPHRADYERRYAELAARFDALDRAVRKATKTVPPAHRKLLTYHDSFPYFAREYGWQVIGAVQPSDFSEPRPRDVGRLIEQIRRERVPAIFGSEVFPSPVLAQIARESGARYVDDLRDDDLPGEPGDPQHTLLGLLVFDFTTIVRALGGDPSAFEDVDTANLPGARGSYR